MPVVTLFSNRALRLSGGRGDIFQYDDLPRPLRVQLVKIIADLMAVNAAARGFGEDWVAAQYKSMVDTLCREYGVFRLEGTTNTNRNPSSELLGHVLESTSVSRALDAVELCVSRVLDRSKPITVQDFFDDSVSALIAELNLRFREHCIGYQFDGGYLVRVDSDLLHASAVKPALTLLRTTEYEGPREEFLKAHVHYRHGRHEEALTDALKAFESTMKAICDRKRWAYGPSSGAKQLVKVCLDNGLIDQYWETHIAGLRATLENGIATVRNKRGGHGQGAVPRTVPREIVTYAMHMTASTIVFLIESANRTNESS